MSEKKPDDPLDLQLSAEISSGGNNGKNNWRSIIYRGIESDELDYKSAMDWNLLSRNGKAKLIRHCLALGNTKGGYIVIGVGEDAGGHPSVYTGLNNREQHSFDPSPVITYINQHVDPPLKMSVERPEVDGKRYAILVVKPFTTLPHVCIDGVEGELQTGVFYIRTTEAASRAARRAMELQGLIQRAMRNQRNVLAQMLRNLLFESGGSGGSERAEQQFLSEWEDIRNYFYHRDPESDRDEYRIELYFYPSEYKEDRISLTDIKQATKDAYRLYNENYFVRASELSTAYLTNRSFRLLSKKRRKIWQFNRSGLGACIIKFPLSSNREIDSVAMEGLLTETVGFIGNYYQELIGLENSPEHEIVNFNFRLVPAENLQLRRGNKFYRCRIQEIVLRRSLAVEEWNTGNEKISRQLIKELRERFNYVG